VSDALSFVEIDGQHVELLPARTVMSMFSLGGNGGSGGNGGNGQGGVGVNVLSGLGVLGTGVASAGDGSGGNGSSLFGEAFERVTHALPHEPAFHAIEIVSATARPGRHETQLVVTVDREGGVDMATCERRSGAGEAFVGVWRNAARYAEGRASVRTWVLSITHHRSIDILRRRRPISPLPEVEQANEALTVPDVWPEVARAEDAAAVRAAMARAALFTQMEWPSLRVNSMGWRVDSRSRW